MCVQSKLYSLVDLFQPAISAMTKPTSNHRSKFQVHSTTTISDKLHSYNPNTG